MVCHRHTLYEHVYILLDWMFPTVDWMFPRVDWAFPKVDWMFPKVDWMFPISRGNEDYIYVPISSQPVTDTGDDHSLERRLCYNGERAPDGPVLDNTRGGTRIESTFSWWLIGYVKQSVYFSQTWSINMYLTMCLRTSPPCTIILRVMATFGNSPKASCTCNRNTI